MAALHHCNLYSLFSSVIITYHSDDVRVQSGAQTDGVVLLWELSPDSCINIYEYNCESPHLDHMSFLIVYINNTGDKETKREKKREKRFKK